MKTNNNDYWTKSELYGQQHTKLKLYSNKKAQTVCAYADLNCPKQASKGFNKIADMGEESLQYFVMFF